MHGLEQNQPVIVIEGRATIDPSRTSFEQHCKLLSGLNPRDLLLAITAVHMKNSQPEVCASLSLDAKQEQDLWLQ